eukprot:g60168.t1
MLPRSVRAMYRDINELSVPLHGSWRHGLPYRARPQLIGSVALALCAAGGWLWSCALASTGEQHLQPSAAFQPAEGMQAVLVRPGPGGVMPIVPPPQMDEPPATIFAYGAPQETLVQHNRLAKATAGRVYGLHEGTALALLTGQAEDHLHGQLLEFPHDAFSEAVREADALYGFKPDQPSAGLVRRALVSVVGEDGQWTPAILEKRLPRDHTDRTLLHLQEAMLRFQATSNKQGDSWAQTAIMYHLMVDVLNMQDVAFRVGTVLFPWPRNSADWVDPARSMVREVFCWIEHSGHVYDPSRISLFRPQTRYSSWEEYQKEKEKGKIFALGSGEHVQAAGELEAGQGGVQADAALSEQAVEEKYHMLAEAAKVFTQADATGRNNVVCSDPGYRKEFDYVGTVFQQLYETETKKGGGSSAKPKSTAPPKDKKKGFGG